MHAAEVTTTEFIDVVGLLSMEGVDYSRPCMQLRLLLQNL